MKSDVERVLDSLNLGVKYRCNGTHFRNLFGNYACTVTEIDEDTIAATLFIRKPLAMKTFREVVEEDGDKIRSIEFYYDSEKPFLTCRELNKKGAGSNGK